MIKFFRHIRHSLVKQNKMGKYFKYAVGEIILVMIGILFALQVNNWNENRKNNSENRQLIQKLDKELQLNIERIKYLKADTIIGGYEYLIKRNESLKPILLKGITSENIELIVYQFFRSNKLNLNTSTYEEMKNTGKLYTLGKQNLIKEIELYYKLCERESFYVLRNNDLVSKQIYKDINSGWLKFILDNDAQGIDFAIKNNNWVLDRNSEQYNAHLRLVDYSNFLLKNIVERLNRVITASEALRGLIQKDLNTKKE